MILRIPRSQSIHLRRIYFLLAALIALPLVVALAAVQLRRPVPPIAMHDTLRTEAFPAVNVDFPWPATGAAALGVDGIGQVAAFHDERQRRSPASSR